MADFCKHCSIRMFGEDMDGIKANKDEWMPFLCEGHGAYVAVDEHGEIMEVRSIETGELIPDGGSLV